MAKLRQSAKKKHHPTTVSLSREALEIIDAHADTLKISRSEIVEELILTHLRTTEHKEAPLEDPLPAKEDLTELMQGAVRTPIGTDPERDERLREAWNRSSDSQDHYESSKTAWQGWDKKEIEKEVAPWPPEVSEREEAFKNGFREGWNQTLPSNSLVEAFSKAVTTAGKRLPELDLTDAAALEEVFASATAANPSNPMAPFKLWIAHYARDAESPTPSDLLMRLYRYVMVK